MRQIDVIHEIARQIGILRLDDRPNAGLGERALFRLAARLGIQDEVTERQIQKRMREVQQERAQKEHHHAR
jgi:hypothetical protein